MSEVPLYGRPKGSNKRRCFMLGLGPLQGRSVSLPALAGVTLPYTAGRPGTLQGRGMALPTLEQPHLRHTATCFDVLLYTSQPLYQKPLRTGPGRARLGLKGSKGERPGPPRTPAAHPARPPPAQRASLSHSKCL